MYSESTQTSEAEPFCKRSQRLLVVDSFREESSSLIFKFRMRIWGILHYFQLFFRFEELILTCTKGILVILFYSFSYLSFK